MYLLARVDRSVILTDETAQFGDRCRGYSGSPARYVGRGVCLFISGRNTLEARTAIPINPDAPLLADPSSDEMTGAHAALAIFDRPEFRGKEAAFQYSQAVLDTDNNPARYLTNGLCLRVDQKDGIMIGLAMLPVTDHTEELGELPNDEQVGGAWTMIRYFYSDYLRNQGRKEPITI